MKAAQVWTVNVVYEFPRPKVHLTKSCGDSVIDSMVVSAIGNLPKDDPYRLPAGQETIDIVAPIVLYPR